jgi:hypothetical protein
VAQRKSPHERLDELEAEFLERLLPALRRVAVRQDGTFFLTKRFMPYPELKSPTRRDSVDALLEHADEILTLRRKLNEPSQVCPAGRLVHYCQRWANIEDRRRPSDATLASHLLKELEPTSQE